MQQPIMLKEGKFGVYEAVSLAVVSCSCKQIFNRVGLNDMWGNSPVIGAIIAFLIGAALFALIMCMLNLTDSENIQDAMTKSLGRVGAGAALICLSVALLLGSCELLSAFVVEIHTNIFKNSFVSYLIFFIAIGAGAIAWIGAESMARASRILITMLVLAIFVILLRSRQWYDPSRLFPLLGNGLAPGVSLGARQILNYGDILALGIIGQSLQGRKYIARIGIWSLSLTGVITVVFILLREMVFSDEMARQILSPSFRMEDMMVSGQFFSKTGDFYTSVLLGAAVLAMGFSIYCASNAYCKAFSIKDIRPVIPAVTFVWAAYCLLINREGEMFANIHAFERKYVWVLLVAPIAVGAIAALFRKNTIKRA